MIDNGSSDGTAEAVRASHPWVQLVASPINLGAVGRNVGVALIDTPYVASATTTPGGMPARCTPPPTPSTPTRD